MVIRKDLVDWRCPATSPWDGLHLFFVETDSTAKLLEPDGLRAQSGKPGVGCEGTRIAISPAVDLELVAVARRPGGGPARCSATGPTSATTPAARCSRRSRRTAGTPCGRGPRADTLLGSPGRICCARRRLTVGALGEDGALLRRPGLPGCCAHRDGPRRSLPSPSPCAVSARTRSRSSSRTCRRGRRASDGPASGGRRCGRPAGAGDRSQAGVSELDRTLDDVAGLSGNRVPGRAGAG